MRRVAVMAGCVAALLFIAAAGRATTTPYGRVIGLIRLCGGPPPGRCFSRDGTAYLLSGHRVLATQKTRHARFSFVAEPGDYTLTATSGGLHGRRPIDVSAGRVVHANIVFGGIS
jgi:hypothetical protein